MWWNPLLFRKYLGIPKISMSYKSRNIIKMFRENRKFYDSNIFLSLQYSSFSIRISSIRLAVSGKALRLSHRQGPTGTHFIITGNDERQSQHGGI